MNASTSNWLIKIYEPHGTPVAAYSASPETAMSLMSLLDALAHYDAPARSAEAIKASIPFKASKGVRGATEKPPSKASEVTSGEGGAAPAAGGDRKAPH